MKPEHLKTIGSTIFWGFFITYFIIIGISKITTMPDAELDAFRIAFCAFELFGLLLEVAAWRIEKKEKENRKVE